VNALANLGFHIRRYSVATAPQPPAHQLELQAELVELCIPAEVEVTRQAELRIKGNDTGTGLLHRKKNKEGTLRIVQPQRERNRTRKTAKAKSPVMTFSRQHRLHLYVLPRCPDGQNFKR
jgi:hypothetical protein